VRAAIAAEAKMAEEAVLMVEALADVTLETTIATADADNIRHQTTINTRLGAQRTTVSGSGNDRGVVMAVVTKAATALVAVTQQLRWQQKVMAAVATAGAVIGDSDEDNDRYDDDNGGGGERGSDGDSGCDRCVYSDEQRRRGR
jgi:hypothetical protein